MSASTYERERRRDPAGLAAARIANRRAGRINAAIRRLQPFADRIEGHLRLELHAAQISGDNARRLAVEREIDALHDELNAIVLGLAEDTSR